MKKKTIYLILGVMAVAIVIGSRIYASNRMSSTGTLGDEIISVGNVSEKKEDKKESTKSGQHNKKSSVQKAEAKEPQKTETAVTSSGKPKEKTREQTDTYPKLHSNKKVHLYASGTARIGDTAYEQYSYVESIAKSYASVVDKMNKNLNKKSKLYSCIVPTSAGITVPDNKKTKIKSGNQQKAIQKIVKKYKGDQTVISLYDTFMKHRDEYIYFRTDHHWTPLGAFYAYTEFCNAKGIRANNILQYKKKTFKGFKGTFYRDTNNNKTLRADNIQTFYPLSGKKISMYYKTVQGQKIHAPLIDNVSRYGESLKYCAFISGDNPLTVIKNKAIKDGSSCVVVKESFGNVFVPYLADHYQNVYVIDYRYWSGKLSSFVQKKKVQDVILLNNISMTRNSYLVSKLGGIAG